MPLLDIFFMMLWFFLFVAWTWLLIAVYADVFRSKDLGGVAKAFWVIFVLVLPYLGVLVYLIARGGTMADRAVGPSMQAHQPTDTSVHGATSNGSSTATEIAKLADLRNQGVLTADEFDAQKARLLV